MTTLIFKYLPNFTPFPLLLLMLYFIHHHHDYKSVFSIIPYLASKSARIWKEFVHILYPSTWKIKNKKDL